MEIELIFQYDPYRKDYSIVFHRYQISFEIFAMDVLINRDTSDVIIIILIFAMLGGVFLLSIFGMVLHWIEGWKLGQEEEKEKARRLKSPRQKIATLLVNRAKLKCIDVEKRLAYQKERRRKLEIYPLIDRLVTVVVKCGYESGWWLSKDFREEYKNKSKESIQEEIDYYLEELTNDRQNRRAAGKAKRKELKLKAGIERAEKEQQEREERERREAAERAEQEAQRAREEEEAERLEREKRNARYRVLKQEIQQAQQEAVRAVEEQLLGN